MNLKEKWKDIEEYEGLYQISNMGKIRSMDHYASNGKSIILYKGKTKKLHTNKRTKYLSVMLSKNNKDRRFYIHRLVAQAFIPNPQNLPQVNHIDGDKKNNCVNNLEWCSRSYNMEHAKKLGLYDTPKCIEYRNRFKKGKING